MMTLNHPARHEAATISATKPIRTSKKWVAQVLTFLMVFGPGLIVMEADNDAGAVSTYVQAGAQYETHLLWLLLLLLPITYFVQEIVVRLGIATGRGHAAMIYRRFGKWWGRFSLADLLLVNFLTLVTEFAAIALALAKMGIDPRIGVPVAAAALTALVLTGSYRRWERIVVFLCLLDAVAVIAYCGSPAAFATESKIVLTVYVLQESVAPSLVMLTSRAQAGKMFADIGISIQWRSGRPQDSLPRDFVIIEMLDSTPRYCYPGAVACAMPYDRTHIKVFYDRVRTSVYSQTIPALLAHVFVHEITHVIQGFSRHSSAGVMKARWDAHDFLLMGSKPLPFTQEDVHFIQMGLAAREAQSIASGGIR
jgi:hypothetical protein